MLESLQNADIGTMTGERLLDFFAGPVPDFDGLGSRDDPGKR